MFFTRTDLCEVCAQKLLQGMRWRATACAISHQLLLASCLEQTGIPHNNAKKQPYHETKTKKTRIALNKAKAQVVFPTCRSGNDLGGAP